MDTNINTATGSNLSPTELFVLGLKKMAADAREDPAKFYGFVIREENTKKLLPAAPHQQLFFSFARWHDKFVNRQPVGTGKTFGITALTLWDLGNDPTHRCAIISKTEGMAKKPLKMVSDYIVEPELNDRLALVFPRLQRSPRASDPWTTTRLTIDRPPGIRDASLMALGIATEFQSSRLSRIYMDDMISIENSRTKEGRDDVRSIFDGNIMSRLDPVGGRVGVTNTPWHREDQTFHLESIGWPTLVMDIYGFIRVANVDAAWMRYALDTHLRPSNTRIGGRYDWYRLRAHDPDPEEKVPLFPSRYSAEIIAEIRRTRLPHEFARQFLCEPLSDEAGRCKRDWIEKCKLRGMGVSLESHYTGANPTYTGVDLGVGRGISHDKTVMLTIEKQLDGSKRILDIHTGQYTGPDIVDLINQKHDRYKSMIQVEGNQAQEYIKDFAKKGNKSLPIKSFTTTKVNKHHFEYGVESIFTELRDGKWIIPCDSNGKCHREVQGLIDDMLYYDPASHTSDRLMAMWMAREASRKHHPGDGGGARSGLRREMPHAGGF